MAGLRLWHRFHQASEEGLLLEVITTHDTYSQTSLIEIE